MTKITNFKLLKFGFLIFAPEAHPPLAENLFGICNFGFGILKKLD